MKAFIEKTTTTPWISVMICNKCGKEVPHTEEWNPEFDNFQSFDIIFGYGSELDGTEQDFDLCDSCMVEFIKSFKIEPLSFLRLGF